MSIEVMKDATENGADEGMTADEVVTETETPEGGESTEETEEKPALAGDEKPEGQETDAEGEGATAKPATPAFQPTFKFKHAVEGKNTAEEKEFDARVKSAIKSPEDEKFFRELHEKAYGLDFIKPRFVQAREQNKQWETRWQAEHAPLVQDLQNLGRAIKEGDLGTAMKSLNIPFENLMKYVAEELQYQEMSPAERAAVDHQRQQRQQAVHAQDQSHVYRSQAEDTSVKLRQLELNIALDRSDIRSVAEAVDAAHGPGTFRNEIIRRGKAAALESNIDRPVDEVVQEVAQMFRPWINPQAAADPQAKVGQAAPAPAQASPQAQPTRRKPGTLPNVEAQATVPVRKEITSLDALRKHSRELENIELAD